MQRLTITISDEAHRALKETALRRGKTIGSIIEESLVRAGVKTNDSAAALVRRARSHSSLDELAAAELAVEETRAHRRS